MGNGVKRIDFGTNPNGANESVFLALHGRHTVYQGVEWVPEMYQDMQIPLLLMLHRWDGMIGFPGGNVNPGEDLKTALIREVNEEIRFVVDAEDLVPVVSYEVEGKNRVTHLYQATVDFEVLKAAQSSAWDAKDYLTEITGVFLAHMMASRGGYTGMKGVPALLASPMPPTAREQLMVLGLENGWVTTDHIAQAMGAYARSL